MNGVEIPTCKIVLIVNMFVAN